MPPSPTRPPSAAPAWRSPSRSSTARCPRARRPCRRRSCGTTSTEEGKAALTAAADPSLPKRLAARPDRRGLDDLRAEDAHRLQGPGRVAQDSAPSRGCRPRRHPYSAHSPDHCSPRRDRGHRNSCSTSSDVAKRYGAVAALRSASLAVRPGEVHALMGANGAGKSTLVKILTGAVRPDSGTILVAARRIWPARTRPRRAAPASSPSTRNPPSSRTWTSRLEPAPDRDSGRHLPRLDEPARHRRARPARPGPRACRWRPCASSTSRERWPATRTSCSSTR